MSFSFKADKKRKKREKKKRKDDLQRGKKTKHCDTRTHDVIRRALKRVAIVKLIFNKLLSASTTSYAVWVIFSFILDF